MDHSTFTYLMAPGVGFLEFYPLRRDAPRTIAEFGGLLRRQALTGASDGDAEAPRRHVSIAARTSAPTGRS